MYLDGKKIKIKNYKDSISYDISMVHQEIQVIPDATVAENIVLDKIENYTDKLGRVKWKEINKVAETYLKMVELNVKPTDIIGKMTVAQKQLIQIAKVLSANAQYILLDEPTSSLTKYEAVNLFRIVKKLKEENRCIIFVSHKIEEVMEICDRVTVLRDGKTTGTKNISDITRNELINMMIGRDENITHMGHLDIKDEIVLEARNIGKVDQFDGIDLKLKKGEILGLYGLVGAGRTELAKLIVGAEKKDFGEVLVDGKPAKINSLKDALAKYKIGYITENRKEEGLILSYDVNTNMNLNILDKHQNKFKKLRLKGFAKITNDMVKNLAIKTPTIETLVEGLSGGNQQKVSIGKWLAADCDILIVDEPTVGVDVGAKRNIHDLIWKLAKEEGKSIILISSDMPEMITLARRILVFKDYKITGEIDDLNEGAPSYDQISMRIGELMT